MPLIALESASSALTALNTKLDVTANNLANVNTTGFKASRVNFQDLLYIERGQPGVENANGDQRPTGLYVGMGVRVSGTQGDFSQGSPQVTNSQTDIMIEGRGFFQVSVEDDLGVDGFAYTRAGNFVRNSEGELVLASDQGRRLEPEVVIPEDATEVSIKPDGRVFIRRPGDAAPEELTTITVAAFVNPTGLKPVGENLFVETAASGEPLVGDPGTDGRGLLLGGYLEASNVDPTRELIDLIRTQRAFEMNSQTIRTADETLRNIATLRR